jgi:hypothetical protein
MVEMMNCKACRIEIEDMRLGESLSYEALAHADGCVYCRAFREERAAIRHLVGSLEKVPAPPDFDFRLRARLARSEESRRVSWGLPALSRVSIALVASLALIIVAAVLFRQINFNGTSTTQTPELARTTPTASNPLPATVAASSEAGQPVQPTVTRIGNESENISGQRMLLAVNRRGGAYRGRSLDAARNAANPVSSEPIFTAEFGVSKTAPQITPPGIYNPAVDPGPALVVPVRALGQPVKLLLGQGRGTMQTVSLKSVTFGSEKLVEQSVDKRLITSDASDIW